MTFDQYGNDGTFPYTCTTCGVTCESVEELAGPEHHDWPKGKPNQRATHRP